MLRNGSRSSDSSQPEAVRLQPKRDFVGFGGDDFTRLYGMPGFSYEIPLPNLGAAAQGVFGRGPRSRGRSACPCLPVGWNCCASAIPSWRRKVPGLDEGCRAAVWADYNGDSSPDLLLATPTGLRLYTNLGNGAFRDDTALLPSELVTTQSWPPPGSTMTATVGPTSCSLPVSAACALSQPWQEPKSPAPRG